MSSSKLNNHNENNIEKESILFKFEYPNPEIGITKDNSWISPSVAENEAAIKSLNDTEIGYYNLLNKLGETENLKEMKGLVQLIHKPIYLLLVGNPGVGKTTIIGRLVSKIIKKDVSGAIGVQCTSLHLTTWTIIPTFFKSDPTLLKFSNIEKNDAENPGEFSEHFSEINKYKQEMESENHALVIIKAIKDIFSLISIVLPDVTSNDEIPITQREGLLPENDETVAKNKDKILRNIEDAELLPEEMNGIVGILISFYSNIRPDTSIWKEFVKQLQYIKNSKIRDKKSNYIDLLSRLQINVQDICHLQDHSNKNKDRVICVKIDDLEKQLKIINACTNIEYPYPESVEIVFRPKLKDSEELNYGFQRNIIKIIDPVGMRAGEQVMNDRVQFFPKYILADKNAIKMVAVVVNQPNKDFQNLNDEAVLKFVTDNLKPELNNFILVATPTLRDNDPVLEDAGEPLETYTLQCLTENTYDSITKAIKKKEPDSKAILHLPKIVMRPNQDEDLIILIRTIRYGALQYKKQVLDQINNRIKDKVGKEEMQNFASSILNAMKSAIMRIVAKYKEPSHLISSLYLYGSTYKSQKAFITRGGNWTAKGRSFNTELEEKLSPLLEGFWKEFMNHLTSISTLKPILKEHSKDLQIRYKEFQSRFYLAMEESPIFQTIYVSSALKLAKKESGDGACNRIRDHFSNWLVSNTGLQLEIFSRFRRFAIDICEDYGADASDIRTICQLPIDRSGKIAFLTFGERYRHNVGSNLIGKAQECENLADVLKKHGYIVHGPCRLVSDRTWSRFVNHLKWTLTHTTDEKNRLNLFISFGGHGGTKYNFPIFWTENGHLCPLVDIFNAIREFNYKTNVIIHDGCMTPDTNTNLPNENTMPQMIPKLLMLCTTHPNAVGIHDEENTLTSSLTSYLKKNKNVSVRQVLDTTMANYYSFVQRRLKEYDRAVNKYNRENGTNFTNKDWFPSLLMGPVDHTVMF